MRVLVRDMKRRAAGTTHVTHDSSSNMREFRDLVADSVHDYD